MKRGVRMFGILIAIMNLFNNFRMDYQERKEVAKQRINEVKNKVRAQKGLPPEDSPTTKPKVIDRVLSTMLYFIALIVAFFEILVIFIMLLKYILIFLLAIIVIIIIFAFLALLQSIISDKENMMGELEKPPVGDACYQQIQGQLQWTIEELNAKGSTLKTAEKNQYKLGVLARENYEGTLTGKKMLDIEGLPIDKKVLFAIGLLSTEGIASNMDSMDIMKDIAKVNVNSAGYGYFGIKTSDRLSNYINSTQIATLKSKYSPVSSPPYDAAFAPYGMVMSLGHQEGKYKAYSGRDSVSKQIDRIAAEWGIVANKAEFKGYTILFLTQAQYHGAVMDEYDGYINWFAGLFAVSHTDDSKRSFHNYQLVSIDGGNAPYNEGGATRSLYIGAQDYAQVDNYSSPAEFPGLSSQLKVKFHLNGNPINESLWAYVAKNQKNPTGFNKAVAKLKYFGQKAGSRGSGGGVGARVLNFHYGLNSLFQGQRIENDLAKAMSISGETKAEMVCSDGTTKPVTPGNFQATPGQSQVIIDGKPLKQYMDEYYAKAPSGKVSYLKGLEKFWGTSSYLENESNPARKAGYVDKIHGVPFYGQASSYNEKWGTYPYVPNGNTFYRSACMIYSYAYAASSQLGILINPAEMGSMLHANGGFSGNLVYTGVVPGVMNKLGLQGKNATNLNELDSYLDKGGVAVIRTKPGPEKFTSWEHFQVITGKESKDGKTMYHMYTSSYHTQSSTLYTLDQIKRNIGWSKQNPVLYVWK